jgi:hypothetical protein
MIDSKMFCLMKPVFTFSLKKSIKLVMIDSKMFCLILLPLAKQPQWVHPTEQRVILFSELLQEGHAWSR